MPFAEVNDLKFHYQQKGEGPDVILIHGMGGNMSFWHVNTTLYRLMKEFRVTIYDLKGHGYSTFVDKGYTSADMATDLNGIMESIGLEKAYMVGHSFGGLVALHTAVLYPERVSGLVLTEVSVPALTHLIDLDKWPYKEERKKRLMEIDPRLPNILDGFNMYLLEYRDAKIPLASGGEFQIPSNVYIIGTMNTADRSIALVDHALRRRFGFVRLRPEYEILKKHLVSQNLPTEGLIKVLREMNQAINDQNYSIGISFFMGKKHDLEENMEIIWKSEIESYLEEYFYDQPTKVDDFRWENLSQSKLKEWTNKE